MSVPHIPVEQKQSEPVAPSRGFWFMRDIPTAVWLILTVVATIIHRDLPAPRWLMIHLLLLGAITHAILVWSQYFSYALLRSRATIPERRAQNIRLILANSGAILVLFGVPSQLWMLTVSGAAMLVCAVLWHGLSLYRRVRTSMPGRFGRTVYYYISAAGLLAIGASLGAVIAHGENTPNLVLAHALVNVLGWIGLTVAGTLVTLWPTMLRTRVDEFASHGAKRALPILGAGVLVAALGATLGWLWLLTVGLVVYLIGLCIIALSLLRAARQTAPRSFATLSVGMAFLWWIGSLLALIIGSILALIQDHDFQAIKTLVEHITPFLAAGFAAQVLVGALSYLIPVVLGGGPTPVRLGTASFDRMGPFRIALANAALAVCALPISSLMRVVASILYIIAMASFLPIMTMAMRKQSRAKKSGETLQETRRGPIPPEGEKPVGLRAGQAVAGLMAVLIAVAATAAADPISLRWNTPADAPSDAPVMTVQVEAANMRFTPDVIEVPVGTRLVIELTNTDDTHSHDLVLAHGVAGNRLAPGESETLDIGVVTENIEGWCSIVGHRQLGMVLTVVAVGNGDSQGLPPDTSHTDHSDHSGGGMIDLMADPGEGFQPYIATLPALPASEEPTTHEISLVARDTLKEVAPGVTQTLWTYNDTAPGPTLHGRVGDTFVVTLSNETTMGHSIDFHAGSLAPDEPMRTIGPGETLTYTFTATRSGIWMYHCSTMPMTAHIANGMYGAVVIEPNDLPEVDQNYVLVQGEYYLGDHDGGEVDMDKILERKPDLVVFNGYANQYDHAPLAATVGERVRVWVLDAGIERSTSFHIVGGQFDTVWKEGQYLINRATETGSQALDLAPAQGGFVELIFPEAGHYPFVSHFMIDGELGAHGIFDISEP